MRDAAVFELCYEKAGCTGVGRLNRRTFCMIVQYLEKAASLSDRLWKNTKVRIGTRLYSGYVLDVGVVSGINKVCLSSGQLVSIYGDSVDIYDTVLEEEAPVPHVLTHITPEFLTEVLAGPKYQPRVTEIIKFRVLPNSITSAAKLRVKYFVEGETIAAPKGKPKLLFVKLAQPGISGSPLQGIREVYAYERVLHQFTMQVAPLCFHAVYSNNAAHGIVVLQDLGMWRPGPPSGLSTRSDVRLFATTLARLHETCWDNEEALAEHFVDPATCCMYELEALTDGAEEAFEQVAEYLSNEEFVTHTKALPASILSSSYFKNKWKDFVGVCRESLSKAFESQPRTLCHLSLSPDHVFFGPKPNDPCLFIDWQRMNAAPVGFDIAAGLLLSSVRVLQGRELNPWEEEQESDTDFTEDFFQQYHETLLQGGVKTSVEELKGYATQCLAPLLLIAVCQADDALQHRNPNFMPADKEVWAKGARRLLTKCLSLAEKLIESGELNIVT